MEKPWGDECEITERETFILRVAAMISPLVAFAGSARRGDAVKSRCGGDKFDYRNQSRQLRLHK